MAMAPAESVLEAERDRLLNSIAHLTRSNAELREALGATGPDRDFKQAIEENIVVLARYRARVEALEAEIRRAKGQPEIPIEPVQLRPAAQPPQPPPTSQPQAGSAGPAQPGSAQDMDVDSAAPAAEGGGGLWL